MNAEQATNKETWTKVDININLKNIESITYTGFTSLCKYPEEWINWIACRICLPRRKVVLRLNEELGWLLLSSAKLLPCNCMTR